MPLQSPHSFFSQSTDSGSSPLSIPLSPDTETPFEQQFLRDLLDSFHARSFFSFEDEEKYFHDMKELPDLPKINRIISLLDFVNRFTVANIHKILNTIIFQNGGHNLLDNDSIYSVIKQLKRVKKHYIDQAQRHPHSQKIANALFILHYNLLLTESNGAFNCISIVTSKVPQELGDILSIMDSSHLLNTNGQENLFALLRILTPDNAPRIRNNLLLLKHFKLLEKEAQKNFEKVIKDSSEITSALLALVFEELEPSSAQEQFEKSLAMPLSR